MAIKNFKIGLLLGVILFLSKVNFAQNEITKNN